MGRDFIINKCNSSPILEITMVTRQSGKSFLRLGLQIIFYFFGVHRAIGCGRKNLTLVWR